MKHLSVCCLLEELCRIKHLAGNRPKHRRVSFFSRTTKQINISEHLTLSDSWPWTFLPFTHQYKRSAFSKTTQTWTQRMAITKAKCTRWITDVRHLLHKHTPSPGERKLLYFCGLKLWHSLFRCTEWACCCPTHTRKCGGTGTLTETYWSIWLCLVQLIYLENGDTWI